jgi:peptide/nickel transport system substrate-binding protein
VQRLVAVADSDNSKLRIIAWRNDFDNKELTDGVEQAAQELDTQKRVALYHKMQQQFWDDAPIAFLLQQNAVAVARENVSGFHLGPQSDFIRYTKKNLIASDGGCAFAVMTGLCVDSAAMRRHYWWPR